MREIYQDKLRVIASDEFMLKALKIIVMEKIEQPEINETDDDKVLGQKYRASKKAEKIINDVLDEISSYKDNKLKNNLIHKEK